MKKVLKILIPIILSLVLGACNVLNGKEETETEQHSKAQSESTSDMVEGDNGGMNVGSDIDKSTMVDYIYMSLDDFLTFPTDIIKAKFVNRTIDTENRTYYYEFEVIENVRGLGFQKNIIISAMAATHGFGDPTGKDLTYTTGDIRYEQGKTYLLLLTRYTSVYHDGDILDFVNGSLIIPIDENGNAYLKPNESMIFGGEYLGDHLGSDEIADAFANGTFEEYAVNAIKDNPLARGNDYIKSTEMGEILQNSECVLEVVIEYIDKNPIYSKDRVVCNCRVASILKGDYTRTNPTIIFPLGEYTAGETYIVAVNAKGEDTILTMSSKNSVYRIEQKDRIISILSE